MEAFAARPDVLDLIAKLDESEDLKFNQRESAFGKVAGCMVSYRGVPLGLTAERMPYHSFAGDFDSDSVLVLLAPTLRASDHLPLVHVDVYEAALHQLLTEELPSWTLICERDCDQDPIRKFGAESEEANKAIGELFDFLRGKAGSTCPTFVVTKGL